MPRDMEWATCPFCHKEFLDHESDGLSTHIVECAKERQALAHPEVGEGPESEDEMAA